MTENRAKISDIKKRRDNKVMTNFPCEDLAT